MFPACCSVFTQLGARLLINGTIRLRVTQHFQVSLLNRDTELNIEPHAEEDDPVPDVLRMTTCSRLCALGLIYI